MTSPRNGSPTRALVLGGGGAVGVGWQTGLLIGLREAGVDLAGAKAIVGTSAGALVGALLSSGRDVTDALTSLAALGQSIDPDGLAAGDAGFRCTAIDTETGDLVVWDQGSGVPLLHAVASSCSVPMLFPTVTIKGRHYMDGGILSHLNATAAPPTDVLVVLSGHPLGSQGGAGGGLATSVTPDAELAPLRET